MGPTSTRFGQSVSLRDISSSTGGGARLLVHGSSSRVCMTALGVEEAARGVRGDDRSAAPAVVSAHNCFGPFDRKSRRPDA